MGALSSASNISTNTIDLNAEDRRLILMKSLVALFHRQAANDLGSPRVLPDLVQVEFSSSATPISLWSAPTSTITIVVAISHRRFGLHFPFSFLSMSLLAVY